MSSTRHASSDGPYRQERYASSPDFERGLRANLVARRCSNLDHRKHRELIWWLQWQSHQEGGLTALTKRLVETYPERVCTQAMARIGRHSGNYTKDQVQAIRDDLPGFTHHKFILKGERKEWNGSVCNGMLETPGEALLPYSTRRLLAEAREPNPEDDIHPTGYPVETLLEFCRDMAINGYELNPRDKIKSLDVELAELCLDPEFPPAQCSPLYFQNLAVALSAIKDADQVAAIESSVVTSLGRKVHEALEYTAEANCLTVIEGGARLGKTFAAHSWCEQRAGMARFVEVPTGNDELSFFRALARGLGLGTFLNYKLAEIRARVESVLLTCDLLICLDEAHRLWPQTGYRYGFPARINWLMSMVNAGVAFCCVSTPQFIASIKATEERTGWNSAQLQGRLGHYEELPTELTGEDLTAVARVYLPEADLRTLKALAAYARTSARYLAAIEAITNRAKFIAKKAGRDSAETADVRRAMEESVIPSDNKLVAAVTKTNRSRHSRSAIAAPLPADGSDDAGQASALPPTRETAPIRPPGIGAAGDRLSQSQLAMG